MACARDGLPNAQIHSLETNGGRGATPASTRRSASPCTPPVFLAPSQKDWLQLRAAYKHREGSWQISLSTLRTTSAVSRANRASSKSAAARRRVGTPLMLQQRPHAPGDRAATSSSPSAAPTWMRVAGTSATSSISAATPMWITPALAWPSSAACSMRMATRWVSSASPTGPTPPASRCSASRAWAFSSAPATWTPWSTTIR